MGFTIEGSARGQATRAEDATNRHMAMKIARSMRDAFDGRSADSVVTVRSERGIIGYWRGSPDVGWHSADPNAER